MPTGSKRKAPSPPRDPADDCETPDVAYAHIAPLLRKLAQRLGKPPGALRIWDPYYCAGGVKARLGALGFGDVVNDPDADFYDVVDGSRPPPPHDICVTNPPFSGNHARRLFEYLNSRGERSEGKGEKKGNHPVARFAVLAPEYVHRKAWFKTLPGTFFMVPSRRYSFVSKHGGRRENTAVECRHWRRERGSCPRGETCPFVHVGPGIDPEGERIAEEARRSKANAGFTSSSSGGGVRTVAPFDCYWHCHLGEFTGSVAAAWRQKHGRKPGRVGVRMVDGVEGLPPPPDKSAKRARGG